MEGRRTAIVALLRIQFSFNGRSVVDNAQARATREQAEVARMLRSWRMMQKFGGVTFADAVGVADAELMLIDEETVRWGLALKKSNRAFGSPNPANKRAGQQGNDAEVGDEKSHVMFTPRPARQRRHREVRAKQHQPDIEPGRAINVGAGDFRVEARFVNRASNRSDDQDRE